MKKTIAIILSVLLVMGVVSVVAASAADATVQIGESSFECSQGDTLTYTINMTTPKAIENGQFIVYYPGSCLTVKSVTFNENIFGGDKPILNTAVENEIDFNFSKTDGYDFTAKSELVKVEFEVTGTGTGKVNISDKAEEIIVCDVDDEDITAQVAFEEVGSVPSAETEPATGDVTQPETQPVTVAPTSPAETTPAATNPPAPATVKKVANTIKVTVKAKTVKAKKLKKKKQTVKAITVKNAKGAVTFTKVKKGTTSKIFKKVTVNKKTGKITLKKGKYAKKTYKVKVKIKAAGKKVGNVQYKAKTLTKVVKIKVK